MLVLMHTKGEDLRLFQVLPDYLGLPGGLGGLEDLGPLLNSVKHRKKSVDAYINNHMGSFPRKGT